MEIECANLPLIPHPPHVLLLSLSVRSYEYNPFSQSTSFSCVFFCCLDPSLAWWLHLGPFGFPLASFLGSCQSCFPLPNLRVTCCAQEVIPFFLPSLTPTSRVIWAYSYSIPSWVQQQTSFLQCLFQVSCTVALGPDLIYKEQCQTPAVSLFWLAKFLGNGFCSYLLLFLNELFSVALETDYYSESQVVAGALATSPNCCLAFSAGSSTPLFLACGLFIHTNCLSYSFSIWFMEGVTT